MPRASRRRLQSWSFPIIALTLMSGEWILLVAGTRLHEMVVGAVSVGAAALFLNFVRRSSSLQVDLHAADLAAGWRIPGYIAIDTWVVVKVLFQDLFSIRRASSFYRVCGFRTSKRDPHLIGRSVLATVYTTASPNSIVIGIDAAQSRMLLHQLQRSPLSRMDIELGAKP